MGFETLHVTSFLPSESPESCPAASRSLLVPGVSCTNSYVMGHVEFI